MAPPNVKQSTYDLNQKIIRHRASPDSIPLLLNVLRTSHVDDWSLQNVCNMMTGLRDSVKVASKELSLKA